MKSFLSVAIMAMAVSVAAGEDRADLADLAKALPIFQSYDVEYLRNMERTSPDKAIELFKTKMRSSYPSLYENGLERKCASFANPFACEVAIAIRYEEDEKRRRDEETLRAAKDASRTLDGIYNSLK